MGRRRLGSCWVVSERPHDNPEYKSTTVYNTACGEESTYLPWRAEDRSSASCAKCVEVLAKEDLAAMDNPLKLGARLTPEEYDVYRSKYPLLDGEDEVGMVRLPHGWGKNWEVLYPYFMGETITYFEADGTDRGFHSKTAALVWASKNRDKLNTVEEAETDYEERRKRAQEVTERQAREDADERQRLDDTIEGLESVMKNRADMLSNFEMSAVQDAALIVKQARLKV